MTTLPLLGTPNWSPVGGQAQGVVDLTAGRWVNVIAAISSMLLGTPTPLGFAPLGGQGISSRGVTSWQRFDLPAGTYAACMSPMPDGEFTPHALEGMVQVFAIS